MMLALAIGLACLGAGDAAPADVYATLTPPEIPFHRQARFTVVVEAGADTTVEIPELSKEFGALTVVGTPMFATERMKGGRVRTTRTYTLESVFTGNYPIKPVRVTLNGSETLTLPGPGLRVRDLTEEEQAAAERFEPNAGPLMPYPGLLGDWRFWAAAAPAAALLACAAIYAFRRRRVPRVAPPPPPPWEVAYGRLRELDGLDLPAQGAYDQYYVALSDILRRYIEERFLLHAPERTTPEFLAEASAAHALTQEHQALLARFLRHCDRVKFARYEPTAEEMDKSLSVVLQFVDETVPKPAAAEEEAA